MHINGLDLTSAASPIIIRSANAASLNPDVRSRWAHDDIPDYAVHIVCGQTLQNDQTWCGVPIGPSHPELSGTPIAAAIFVSIPDTQAYRENLGWLTLIAALSVRDGIDQAVHGHTCDCPIDRSRAHQGDILIAWPGDVVVHNNACSNRHRHLAIGRVHTEVLGVRNGRIAVSLGLSVNISLPSQDAGGDAETSIARVSGGNDDIVDATPVAIIDRVLASTLVALRQRVEAWAGGNSPARQDHFATELARKSADLNNSMTIKLADGSQLSGYARRYTSSGDLELDTLDGPVLISGADVGILDATGLTRI